MEIDAGFWYLVSFIIFVLAVANPLKKIISTALNEKSNKIQQDLREAEDMKLEAASLLANAKQRQADATKDAQDIIDHAEQEASRFREQSVKDIAEFAEHQKTHLEDRIKLFENDAVKEIHEHMVNVAVATAHEVVKKTLSLEKNEEITTHELKKVKHLHNN